MRLAREFASWSKDPSTQVGCVIVRPGVRRTIAGHGYNGFPRGIADTPERLHDRAQKYPRVVHAELNAILNATDDLTDSTLYVWPIPPCTRCAGPIIQAGIKRVVAPQLPVPERWQDDMRMAADMLEEAGVLFETVEEPYSMGGQAQADLVESALAGEVGVARVGDRMKFNLQYIANWIKDTACVEIVRIERLQDGMLDIWVKNW
jgi:dCMP deaminase